MNDHVITTNASKDYMLRAKGDEPIEVFKIASEFDEYHVCEFCSPSAIGAGVSDEFAKRATEHVSSTANASRANVRRRSQL